MYAPRWIMISAVHVLVFLIEYVIFTWDYWRAFVSPDGMAETLIHMSLLHFILPGFVLDFESRNIFSFLAIAVSFYIILGFVITKWAEKLTQNRGTFKQYIILSWPLMFLILSVLFVVFSAGMIIVKGNDLGLFVVILFLMIIISLVIALVSWLVAKLLIKRMTAQS